MLEDRKVDLIEWLLWGGNIAATTLEKFVQSLACESPPLTNKATSSRRPNEEAISV